MTRAIMLQGTGSDVGKTVLVAGLCRALYLRGIKVAPFKPQNMSNNAAVANDGGEIGRGQWLQAIAAGLEPSIHMNPVLLKPQSETGSQVIVQGKLTTTAQGRDYQALKKQLMHAVLDSYQKLQKTADFIIVEGAGSPAEINLRQNDIANMGFAAAANVPVILVGDIDRGGVIASIVGTHTILDLKDRNLIAGFLINKFRGDLSLFDKGIAAIQNFTGWQSFGIVPWLKAVANLPAEDSVILDRDFHQASAAKSHAKIKHAKIKIVVPIGRHIANFDDLDPLKSEDGVDLILLKNGAPIPSDADIILLLGSKATLADMRFFHENGWAKSIQDHAARGGHVIGICGGLQMLGQIIEDADGVEGKADKIAGLKLLDIATKMTKTKTTRNVSGIHSTYNCSVQGYEIHLGATLGNDCLNSSIYLGGQQDGAASRDGKIWGTYLHGIFNQGVFRSKFLSGFGALSQGVSQQSIIDDALNDIAAELERAVNIDQLLAVAR
ncbi:cobyric acid synthase [Bartonella sp. HY038]|uniref:cobyric acid synthase n=1 Tax=Bartonella sp. HY038 TaxID=2759660 RepID=UPI0015FB9518|nr:cobyric acid synthase [Bartonella sp. HY038]